jgi:SH3-like domain-containing protein
MPRMRLRDCLKSRSGGRLGAIFCAPVLTYLSTLRSGARKSRLSDSPERLLKQSLRGFVLGLLLCGAAPLGSSGPGPGVGGVTKLPVPRFVSLRTNQVNFRAGPGFQYPVSWIYQRDGLPVEIIGEFDVWRQVRAPDGGTGWVHEATVRARRTFYVTAQQAVLRTSANASAAPEAYLNLGVGGELISCGAVSDFCKVAAGHATGYLAREDFWGAFPGEVVK